MAAKRLCTVDGCGNPHMARGLCSRHYKELRRRQREVPSRSSESGEGIKFIRAALTSRTNDCIDWPFSLTPRGYGQIRFKGRMVRAHRLSLILASGLEPPSKVLALHQPGICHNPKCINPKHLRWGTHAENSADMAIDGTLIQAFPDGVAGQNRKLTDDQVRSIRADPRMQKHLAEVYGVSRATICHVKSGKKYSRVV